MSIVTQNDAKVNRHITNRIEVLDLIDACLETTTAQRMTRGTEMSRNKPLAGSQRHGGGHLSETLPVDGQSMIDPCTIILPQNAACCQERTTGEKAQLLALADDVLERHNAARARYIATGNVADFQQVIMYQQDRAALLQDLNNMVRGV